MIYVNQFFFKIFNQLRKIYLHSSLYDRKISKVQNNNLYYKPSSHLLSSLIKYQKKIKIYDFSLAEIWGNNNLSDKELKLMSLNAIRCFNENYNLKVNKNKLYNILFKN